ncbi:hypothetical protein ACVW16_004182 [Bradyrhizobium sp. USDA 4474]
MHLRTRELGKNLCGLESGIFVSDRPRDEGDIAAAGNVPNREVGRTVDEIPAGCDRDDAAELADIAREDWSYAADGHRTPAA